MAKIKGVLTIKKGAYWFPEDSAKKTGIERLTRSNQDMKKLKGKAVNGEVHIDDAYYDEETNTITVQIGCVE